VLGTRVAETILASVHVRARQQAGHMSASDLINIGRKCLRGGGRPHMCHRAAAAGLQRQPRLSAIQRLRSPRAQPIKVRSSVSTSIRSVLTRRLRRFTAIDAASTT
jgi:hypothetical protein